MNVTKKIKSVLLLVLICTFPFLLTGCGNSKRTYTKKDYDKIVNLQLEQVIDANKMTHGQLETTLDEKQEEKLYFTPSEKGELKIIRGNIDNYNADLNKHMLDTAYPKTVSKFGSAVEAYVDTLNDKHTVSQAQQSYHKLMKEMKPLLIYMKSKKTLALANVALDGDNLNYPDFFPKKKKQATSKTLISTDPVEPKRKNKSGINFTKSNLSLILLSLLGILMLVILFLQKPKDNTNLDALTDTGGTDLFSRPKPRGYNKFMLVTTKVMIGVFALILLIIQII